MIVLRYRNVHQALPKALSLLLQIGVERHSRNGPVLVFPEPVTTLYERPTERVVFHPERDANPFFHLSESLWMLGGRNDVEFVSGYVERMRTYSDNGVTLHGAYGHRWRRHFGFDQLRSVAETLKRDPTDRRQVVSMWDAGVDLARDGKDLPCNLQALFSVNEGCLDMMVTNRSNDLIWGAYGANAVHFSYLQEYLAAKIGIPVGQYRQVSNNLHVYLKVLPQVVDLTKEDSREGDSPHDPYEVGWVSPYPLVNHPETFDADLDIWLNNIDAIGFKEPFFRHVAVPMARAYRAFKSLAGSERYEQALVHLMDVRASDWRNAAVDWIQRREAKWRKVNDDGVQYEVRE